MTWHADELIAAATPALLTMVRADLRLLPFAHLVPAREASNLRAAATDLVIVRPLCDAQLSDAGDWYGAPVLDSQSFTGSADVSALHQAFRANVGQRAPTPPLGFLSTLQDLALRVGQPLAYYSCAMWGGDIEHEQAFLLGSEPHVYSKLGNRDAVRLPSAEPSEEDVLISALRELGFELTAPYFEPHTRAFPWEKYRLPTA